MRARPSNRPSLSLLLVLIFSISGSAQESKPAAKKRPIVGNWRIQYQDARRGIVTGHIAIYDSSATPNWYGEIDGTYFRGGRPKYNARTGTMRGTYYPYLERLGFDLKLNKEGTIFQGIWTERNRSDRQPRREGSRKYDNPKRPLWYWAKGNTRWTKLRPKIERIEVQREANGALDWPKMKRDWKYAVVRGNLPQIRLKLIGKDLPTWSTYAFVDVKTYDRFLLKQKSLIDVKSRTLYVYLWLARGIKPGLKRLTLNGVDCTWRLKFSNYEGEEENEVQPRYQVSGVHVDLKQFEKNRLNDLFGKEWKDSLYYKKNQLTKALAELKKKVTSANEAFKQAIADHQSKARSHSVIQKELAKFPKRYADAVKNRLGSLKRHERATLDDTVNAIRDLVIWQKWKQKQIAGTLKPGEKPLRPNRTTIPAPPGDPSQWKTNLAKKLKSHRDFLNLIQARIIAKSKSWKEVQKIKDAWSTTIAKKSASEKVLLTSKLTAEESERQILEVVKQFEEAKANLEEIERKLKEAENRMPPRIHEVQVRSGSQLHYLSKSKRHEDFADLDDILKKLEAEIQKQKALVKQAKDLLDRKSKTRTVIRARFKELGEESIEKGEQMINTIWLATLKKAGISTAVDALDLARAFAEGGPVGLVVEAGTKLIDVGTGGSFSPYDESELRAKYYGTSKAKKPSTAGQIQSWVGRPLEFSGTKVGALEILKWKKPGALEIPKNKAAAYKLLNANRSKAQKLVDKVKDLSTAKSIGKDIGLDLIGSLVKTGFFKYFEAQEKEAWTRFLDHEVRFRRTAIQLQRASAQYWDAYDLHKKAQEMLHQLLASRHELIQQRKKQKTAKRQAGGELLELTSLPFEQRNIQIEIRLEGAGPDPDLLIDCKGAKSTSIQAKSIAGGGATKRPHLRTIVYQTTLPDHERQKKTVRLTLKVKPK